MNHHCDAAASRGTLPTYLFVALTLAAAGLAPCAHAQSADAKPAETRPGAEIYQTLYLTNLTQQNDFNEVLTDLRNMIPKARLYGMPLQNAISIHATPEDIQLAQKILSDLDRAKKLYRLTYTINETDSGKRIGAQNFTLIVASGGRTTLKQGSRIPVFVGTTDARNPTTNPQVEFVGAQVQYEDVGTNIEASIEGFESSLRLRYKVEQSSLSDEKSGVGAQDPIVRQTVLDGASTLVPGKPLILGSLDIPGATRKQEIEVVAELVK